MKREVLVCDICKKSMAVGKCDLCGCDLCKSARCGAEERLSFTARAKRGGSLITKFMFCSKCSRTLSWDGELSDDMKELITDRIKARKMLKAVEKEN